MVEARVEDAEHGERRSGRGAKVLRVFGIALTALLTVLVLAILALQFDGVATRVVNAAADRFAPWSEVRVAHADLDGLGAVTVDGLRVLDAQGDTLVIADSVHLGIRLLPLLNRRLLVPELRIADAAVRMEQAADSTWDLLEPLAGPDTGTAAAQATRPWRIRVGTATVRRASFAARYAAEGDSTLRVEDIALHASDVALGDELRIHLDTLGARILPPARPGSPAELSAAAVLDQGRLVTPGIRLTSDSSNVFARGELLLPGGAAEQIEDIDFTISATPLDFRDIGALVPGFDSPGSLRLEGRVTGSEDALGLVLEAATSDGASIDVEGTITPRTSRRVRYALTGTIRDLEPGLWMDTASAIGNVDADFQLELAGARLEAVNGSVRATASARVGDGSLRPTTIVADFTDGVADITLDGVADPWAAVEASGTVEPFADRPAWDLIVDARQLEPFGAGGSAVTDMRARIRTQGNGISAVTTRGTATLALNGEIGRASVRGGDIRVRWADGEATADLRVPVDSGRLRGSAVIDWSGELTRVTVPGLSTQRLPVAALIGDTIRGTLTADVSGSAELGRPESLEGQVAAVLERATWGTLEVDTGSIRLDAGDGAIAVDGRVVSAAGRMLVDATLEPFAEPATWDIRRLSVEALDLAAAREGMPPSRIDATLAGEFRGSGARTLSGNATLVVEHAALSGRAVDSARVTIAVAEGRVTAGGMARAFDGSITFDAAAQPFAAAPTVRIEQARFDGLRLDSLAGPRFRAPLSGTLELEAAFPADTFPRARATLALGGGPFNAGRIEGGDAEFTLQDGTATLDAMITTGEGSIDIDGTAILADNGEAEGGPGIASGRVQGTVRLPDIARLAGTDTIEADLNARFAAEALPGDTAAWSLLLAAQGRYDDLRVDTLRADGSYAAGILRVDTLRLDSNALNGGGGGVVALGSGARAVGDTLEITLRTDSVDALAALFGGGTLSLRTGVLTVVAVGMPEGARVNTFLAAGGLIRGTTSADTVMLAGRALIVDGSLRSASGELEAARVAAGSVVIDEADATVAWDSTGATFAVNAVPDEERTLRATGVVRPDSQAVLLRQIELGIRDTLWTLQDASRITWGGPIDIDSLRLASGGRTLFVDGRLDRTGTQDLTVRLDSVPVGDFAAYAGFTDIDAVTSGTIRMEGEAERVALTGELRTRIGDAEIDLSVVTDPPGRRLDVDARLLDGEGDPLSVTGSLPFDLSLAPRQGEAEPVPGEVDLHVAADSFDIEWAEPLLQTFGLDRLQGVLEADVNVAGTWESPRLDGTARLAAGRITMPQQGVDYRNMRATLGFDGRAVRVDSLRAESEGSAVVEGRVTLTSLSEPELTLDARLDQFHLVTNQWTRLVASGEAHIEGSPLEPRVTGDIMLVDTDIYGDAAGAGGAAAVELTEQDYEMLANYFGYTPSGAAEEAADRMLPIGLDIDVELGPAVWLLRESQPELRVLLDGSLDVRKQPGDSLQLFGTIEAVPERSTFEQFGRQFQVTEGTITFNGPIMGWQANIAALYEVPSFQDPTSSEVDITLAVSGGMEDLEVTLGSDPSMEMADVLSYIATGRPAASAIEFGGPEDGSGGVLGTGARYALGTATAALENLAADAVGLSVVEVRHTAAGARLIAGRYVSPRLFVGFQQPLSREDRQEGIRNEPFGTQLELEYAAYQWLLVNLQGTASQFRGFFRFKHAF